MEITGDKIFNHFLIGQHECFDSVVRVINQVGGTIGMRDCFDGIGNRNGFQGHGVFWSEVEMRLSRGVEREAATRATI
jgi:hypothetical protein